MSSRIKGVGPNPKELDFLLHLPDFGIERLAHVTTCHYESSPEHDHPGMQLLWILSGELNMELGGVVHTLKAGRVIIVPAQMRHRPISSKAHPVVEMVDLRILPPLASYVTTRVRGFTARFSCKSVKAKVDRLQKLCAQRKNPDAAEVLACTWELLALLGKRVSRNEEPIVPEREARDSRVHAAEAVMRIHLDKALSTEALASHVNISVTHLTRLFRQVRKSGPGAVFRRMRMERARELLVGSCLSVKEIGEACGFSGFNQFVRAFRREFGMPPGGFRRTGGLHR